ncbi:MAG: hypothetical protein GXO56_00435 [Chloroflexi bacterium]|nr:hypothetical protein [Chloroflexota bacterium]
MPWPRKGFISQWAEQHPHLTALLGFGVIAAVGLGGYVFAAQHLAGWGFPLDDAWIHQTYASHLAAWGTWAYRAGQPSAGATAPLWVLLLALGYLLRVSPLVWSALLGWLTLTALGWAGWALWRVWMPQYRGWWPWLAGLVLVTSWHMLWAGLSGMETALAALGMLALTLAGPLAVQKSSAWAGVVGAGVGLMVWLRPETMIVLALLAAVPWLDALKTRSPAAYKHALQRTLALGAGFAALVGPYLLFNLHLAGRIWPNTFYAKQAEYAALRQQPLVVRWMRVALPLFVGPGVVLLPLGFLQMWRDFRNRAWGRLVAPVWAWGHVTLYALRLPVAYQHGRYVMPALAVLLWYGLRGLASLWQSAGQAPFQRWRWILSRSVGILVILVSAAFLGLGAQAYAQDVAVIETEMVATAQWMANHLPTGTRVAAHDIGAVGYFTDFPLVDLAGLVSPEVIPFVRDEDALRQFLDQQDVDVLVVFPDWYTHLTRGLPVLYFNPEGWGPRLGSTHMTVYRWKPH